MRKDHGAHPAKSGGQAHWQKAADRRTGKERRTGAPAKSGEERVDSLGAMTHDCLHVYIACELNQKHMSSHTNGPDLRGTEQMCFSLPPPV